MIIIILNVLQYRNLKHFLSNYSEAFHSRFVYPSIEIEKVLSGVSVLSGW